MHSPLLPLIALLVVATPANALTLAEARATALVRSPSLRIARAMVSEARAELQTAGTYPFNPVLEGAVGRRTGPDAAGTDLGFALSQEIELAGQRGKRSSVARSELASLEARYQHAERVVLAQVEDAYVEAIARRELLKIERIDVELAETHREHARKRLEAGAGTQIEDNVARAAFGRADQRLRAAEAAAMEARSILAEVMGLPVEPLPEPVDVFPELAPEAPVLAELIAAASANRADIQAFTHATTAARSRIALARSEGRPNLVFGGFYDREGGGDKIAGGSIAIAIPVFNRNQGGVALRSAELERTVAAAAGAELAAVREVSAAYYHLLAARATVAGLRVNVIGSLEENLELLRLSFAAGKIGATEVLVFRREFIESQRAYVEAQAFAWQMRVALDLATGRAFAPSSPNQETQP